MANIKSAKKRAKQTVVRNARNTSQRSMLRTAVKRVLKALEANDAAAAEAAYKTAVPIATPNMPSGNSIRRSV